MLETGDVVLIGDFSLPGFVIRFGTKSLYKHVGVAVIINSEPYVLELIASHDVHLTKLKDYLKRGRIARYRKVKSCYRRDLEAKFLSFGHTCFSYFFF